MSIQLAPAPRSRTLKISEICRHLPPAGICYLASGLAPVDGDIAIAEVIECGRHNQLDLAQGRSVPLTQGDLIAVALGRHYAPLDFTGSCPNVLGDCALFSAAGAAGIVTEAFSGSPPTRLRLLGLATDADGETLNLRHLLPTSASTETGDALRIAVVSCARGSHASAVTAAMVRGFSRSGRAVGVAKPTGVVDAAERWRFLDNGALAAVDLVDAGQLCSAELGPEDLMGVSKTLISRLHAAGADTMLMRIAGGLARRDTRALLTAPAFRPLLNGVVLAAADALSAIEGARRLHAAGLRVLAVSGAICRSPLAMAEARNGLHCPVLEARALAMPDRLQAIVGQFSDQTSTEYPQERAIAA